MILSSFQFYIYLKKTKSMDVYRDKSIVLKQIQIKATQLTKYFTRARMHGSREIHLLADSAGVYE